MSDFGNCCKDLKDAMTTPPTSFFRIERNNVLFLTIGYMQTDDAPTGWFDQAVIFCPFCGTKLQNREDIKDKTEAGETIQ